METTRYEKRFHYEKECQRYDAPKDNVGEWLNAQAMETANSKSKLCWCVDKTRIEKQEDGTHIYHVVMRSLANVRDQVSPLASGATSCVSRNRDRSAEGMGINCIAPLGIFYFLDDFQAFFFAECRKVGRNHLCIFGKRGT